MKSKFKVQEKLETNGRTQRYMNNHVLSLTNDTHILYK